ncbi:Thioesterase superfamily protein [Sphingomonas paucimobilis]|nr:Thioesterase superfamily protein [Sphingomonas paucimobilis]
MSFETRVRVRFADVDPAGIVFYPRYFEMLNGLVEDWFASLGTGFRAMHIDQHIGVPTVKLEVEFLSPSELEDELTLRLDVRELGRSSCTIAVTFMGEGRDRLRARVVLVCMDLAAQRSRPWPDGVRAGMQAQVVGWDVQKRA